MFLQAVLTLILTARIHCTGSTGDVMLHFSKSVPIKKLIHVHLGFSESEYIFRLN